MNGERAIRFARPAFPGIPRRILVACLMAISYLALGVAWIFGEPPGAGVDEPSHFIKAVATGRAELTGRPAAYPVAGIGPEAKAVLDRFTRSFSVPARLIRGDVDFCAHPFEIPTPSPWCPGLRCIRDLARCPADRGDTALVAHRVSYNGRYEPTTYLLPGTLAKLGDGYSSAVRWGRLGILLIAVGSITLAALLLYEQRGSAFTLLGLVVALSPMVVYLTSVVNANSAEIALSICFSAALLRVSRRPLQATRFEWTAAGLSGGMLAFSRALGPIWVLLAVAVFGALVGARRTALVLRSRPRARIAFSAIIAGVVIDELWWSVVAGRIRPAQSLGGIGAVIMPAIEKLPGLFGEQIGVLGWLDVPLTGAHYLAWVVMVIGLITLALLVGTPRQRRVLAALGAVDVVGTVVIAAVLGREFANPTGEVQGRYLIPLSVMVVLLAGEIVFLNHGRLRELAPGRLLLYFGIVVAMGQASAFWLVSRRYADGVNAPLLFSGHSEWAPPLGWLPWLSLAILGCLGLFATTAVAAGVTPLRGRLMRSSCHGTTAARDELPA